MLDAASIYDRLCQRFEEIEALRAPLDHACRLDSTPGKRADLANTIFECVGKNAWKATGKAPNDGRIEKEALTKILGGAKEFF